MSLPAIPPRCPACGRPLPDPVRLNMNSCLTKGRKQTVWLTRKSISVCAACAEDAIQAAWNTLTVKGATA